MNSFKKAPGAITLGSAHPPQTPPLGEADLNRVNLSVILLGLHFSFRRHLKFVKFKVKYEFKKNQINEI